MRAVVQRVLEASITVEGEKISEIGNGLLVLLGVEEHDSDSDFEYIFKKVLNLRVFEDKNAVMNLSLIDQNKELLVVSQFTLYGDVRKGNRPSYIRAAKFEDGINYYNKFIERAKELNISTFGGEYGADMKVQLINDGPVTILLDSNKEF
ncbi:D-aminoacyl-tRNA deacylase [Peptoniphilus sp. oral taxon 386]|uniref:D-aminoacyl-tRNA deacylase n=1 Tax=Peptoniphilus sp. oral taxon 386 TaxID=652713 RepID=UPI0001DA9CD5|nr:D-aminoacyl-tRNA deacylase [Peptoniphilus sp. oral taxon 386]EFI42249.1 D-tyrosyl-tRNA(Tyr) deacylase [Peptoniphilus sp. oral taxon 386 str. F0131]